jgi:hypothetical protein
MFEARLVQGSLFKKIIEAIRELVVDANLDCTETGITMQVIIYISNMYIYVKKHTKYEQQKLSFPFLSSS